MFMVMFLGGYDKAALALDSDLGHGVAFVQIGNNFLFNVHIFCPVKYT